MKRCITAAALTALLITLGGCQKEAAPASKEVAVVDVDKIFAAIGWGGDTGDIAKALKADADAINKAYGDSTKLLKEDMDAKTKGVRDALSKDDQLRFDNAFKTNDPREIVRELGTLPIPKEKRDDMLRAIGVYMQVAQNANNQAQQVLQTRRNKLISQGWTSINPVVNTVAKSEGYTLVLQKQNAAYASEAVDISDDVVRELQKSKPTLPTLEAVVPGTLPVIPVPQTQPTP